MNLSSLLRSLRKREITIFLPDLLSCAQDALTEAYSMF